MDSADVLILGGGLVGSALAVALDAHGLTSIVVDPADPATILAAGYDGRATAIASAPMRMFEVIGVTPRLAGKGCPIEGIRDFQRLPWVSQKEVQQLMQNLQNRVSF